MSRTIVVGVLLAGVVGLALVFPRLQQQDTSVIDHQLQLLHQKLDTIQAAVSQRPSPLSTTPPPAPPVVPAGLPPVPARSECNSNDILEISTSELSREMELHNWTRLVHLCCHTRENEHINKQALGFLYGPPGKEHYALFSYITRKLGDRGGFLITELGTKEGASAVALANDPRNSVFTIDVADTMGHVKRVMSSRKGSEVSSLDVQLAAPNLHILTANITDDSPRSAHLRRMVAGARLVILDTLHFPETHPFEYQFIDLLDKSGFAGILLLDDIHLNGEMERFWASLVKRYGDSKAMDVTRIGHASGTGLVDFCGNTKLVD